MKYANEWKIFILHYFDFRMNLNCFKLNVRTKIIFKLTFLLKTEEHQGKKCKKQEICLLINILLLLSKHEQNTFS